MVHLTTLMENTSGIFTNGLFRCVEWWKGKEALPSYVQYREFMLVGSIMMNYSEHLKCCGV